MTYNTTQFDNNVATGNVEVYTADTFEAAVASCLYTRHLTNGNAFVGPSGRVIHSGSKCYTITPGK